MGCHYCECRKEEVLEGTNRCEIQALGMRHQCCVFGERTEPWNVSRLRWDLIFKEPIGRGKSRLGDIVVNGVGATRKRCSG